MPNAKVRSCLNFPHPVRLEILNGTGEEMLAMQRMVPDAGKLDQFVGELIRQIGEYHKAHPLPEKLKLGKLFIKIGDGRPVHACDFPTRVPAALTEMRAAWGVADMKVFPFPSAGGADGEYVSRDAPPRKAGPIMIGPMEIEPFTGDPKVGKPIPYNESQGGEVEVIHYSVDRDEAVKQIAQLTSPDDPPKRRRGRPRKLDVPLDSPEATDEAIHADPEPDTAGQEKMDF